MLSIEFAPILRDPGKFIQLKSDPETLLILVDSLFESDGEGLRQVHGRCGRALYR